MTTFGRDVEATRLTAGLSTVAKALNAGDVALAAIATCLLPLPLDRSGEAHALLKASPDDPDHPGYPKDTPDGKGGQFRPKDGGEGSDSSERSRRLQKLAARRSVRSIVIRILTARRLVRLALLGLAEFVPGLEAVDTVLLLKDIADITAEFLAEDKAVGIALDFVKGEPHAFEELVASREIESFSSFDAFKKMDLEKRFGPAGEGYDYHHIVEQGANRGLIPAEQINSTTNIIRIPRLLHEEINAIYSGPAELGTSGPSVRDTLRGKSYEAQYDYGLRTFRKIGILQ